MIVCESGLFGIADLRRVHGSAVYKTLVPALTSTGFFLLFHYTWYRHNYDIDNRLVRHPYTIGVFVAFFSFLLTFRLNYGYQRYWEGATAVHQMTSKWLDAAMTLAAFHYQSVAYNDIRPPTFAKSTPAAESIREDVDNDSAVPKQARWRSLWSRKRNGSSRSMATGAAQMKTREVIKSINSKEIMEANLQSAIPIPQRFQEQFRLESLRGLQPNSGLRPGLEKQTRSKHLLNGRKAHVPLPSLFLQEMAHLFSLLAAVAMSALRNDMEFAESPLVEYIPGKPWPPVDPDALSQEVRQQYNEGHAVWRILYFLLGLSRSNRHRTLYNAARPFAVLGGISDEEVLALQQARGPNAKMALVTLWVQEFISREYLAGSTGKVAPPIISRLYQYISDGVVGFQQARKVAYIPFPFVHAQMMALFSAAIMFIFPLLYVSQVHRLEFAIVMNFTTVLCFLGMEQVARELENPFQNVPNDLPLTTFQAQFNEALVTMYAGFHPDAWWEAKQKPSPDAMSSTRPTLPSAPVVATMSGAEVKEENEEEDEEVYLEVVGRDRGVDGGSGDTPYVVDEDGMIESVDQRREIEEASLEHVERSP